MHSTLKMDELDHSVCSSVCALLINLHARSRGPQGSPPTPLPAYATECRTVVNGTWYYTGPYREQTWHNAQQIVGVVCRQYYKHMDSAALRLDYGCIVWDPYLRRDKQALEKVPKFAGSKTLGC